MSLSSDHSAPRAAPRMLGDALKDSSTQRCAQPRCRKEGLFPAPCADERQRWKTRLCLKHARDANSAWNIFADMNDAEVERAVRAAAVGERPTWPINAPFWGKRKNAEEATQNSSQNSSQNFWQKSRRDARHNSPHGSFGDPLKEFCDGATQRHVHVHGNVRGHVRGHDHGHSAHDPLAENTHDERTSSSASKRRHPRTQAQREACRVMSLTPPFCAQQLKTRYRTLAKAHHPDQHLAKSQGERIEDEKLQDEGIDDEDTNAAAQERFKRINAAYALLQELWQQTPRHEPAVRRKA